MDADSRPATHNSIEYRTLGIVVAVALLCGAFAGGARAQGVEDYAFRIAAVKYSGGGDWYQARTPLPTFLAFVREHTLLPVAPEGDVVELSSEKVFTYPFLVLSGHGNVRFSEEELRRLRQYLRGGGFLYIDDDYGIDKYIRRELKDLFTEGELKELPFSHGIYHARYDFPNGLPKIHKHDGKAPKGFGLFVDGRLAVFYTDETNLTDGWEPPSVHGDPPEKRHAALRMGTNILVYAVTH